MQIDFTRRGFAVHFPGGRYRRYPYLVLAPLLLTPLVFIAALLMHDPVRTDFRRVGQDPRFLAVAAASLARSSFTAAENLAFARPVSRTSEIPTLRLFASKQTLTEMQRAIRTGDPDLGHDEEGDRPYLPAVLIDEHELIYDCKISLRGANQWHHWEEKPSLRVKLRKSEVRHNQRYIELSRPKDVLALKNWLPQQFACRLGLFSDRCDHVRLFLNGKYLGVYVRSMRPGEALALAHDRLPGTFFKGDAEGDVLWDSLQPWVLHGSEEEPNLANFRRLLRHLRQLETPDDIAELRRLIDMESYAKRAALMIVTGSVHTDNTHNHLYFISSNRGLVEAVPWDCQSYGMLADPQLPPDFILHPLMAAVLCDPRWVHCRNQHVHDMIHSIASPEQVGAVVDAMVDRMLPDLQADVHLASLEQTPSGWRLMPYSVLDIEDQRHEIKDWAKQRHDYLSEYLSRARVFVRPHPTREGVSRVSVFGTVAVEAHDRRSPQAGKRLLLPGLSVHAQPYQNRPYSRATVIDHLVPAALTYSLEIPPDNLHFTNAITGEPVEPESNPPPERPVPRSVHPALFPEDPVGDVILGPGPLDLTADLVIGPCQRLIVRPGTTLRISEGVGVYSRGVTIIEGTPTMPVRMVASGPEPWAAFAVYGDASRGSRFAHLHISGGSSGSDGVAHFKGMFNVYNCPQVTLRGCVFGRNFNSDDAANLVESQVLIEACRWADAAADGLDLDLCSGTLSDCQWENCGNDGLDLMGCQVRITDCQFLANDDKGISIGERTTATVTDSTVTSCDIGLEVKDASTVLVRDTSFDKNRLAVHSYQKHWLYGSGGRTTLSRCRIDRSTEADLSVEQRSRAFLHETPVERIAEGPHRVTAVDALGAQWRVE